jgi:hypothetical protein
MAKYKFIAGYYDSNSDKGFNIGDIIEGYAYDIYGNPKEDGDVIETTIDGKLPSLDVQEQQIILVEGYALEKISGSAIAPKDVVDNKKNKKDIASKSTSNTNWLLIALGLGVAFLIYKKTKK